MDQHYKILGIKSTSSMIEIEQSYKQLAKKIHPDKGGNSYLFQQITNSYNILKSHKGNHIDNKHKLTYNQSKLLQYNHLTNEYIIPNDLVIH